MHTTHTHIQIVGTNKFGKVAGNRNNIQKLAVFLYTNNEPSEREIKKIIVFTIASKNTWE